MEIVPLKVNCYVFLSSMGIRFPNLLRRIVRQAHGSLFEPISAAPLACFRIAFASILLLEFLHYYYHRNLILLEFPFTQEIPSSTLLELHIWFVVIICLLLGFLTPITAALNYYFVSVYFQPYAKCSYHADMIYLEAAALIVFYPLGRRLSIDSLLLKKFFGIDTSSRPIPRIYNDLLIFYAAGLMYFDSTIYKLASPFWLDGLGFWLPASYPSFTTFSWNALLNQYYFAIVSGYITLIFELVFIFLFWFKALRVFLVPLGLILHFGIGIVFPIPLFGLIMAALYLNFFPDIRMNRLLSRFSRSFEIRTKEELDSVALSRFDTYRAYALAVVVACLAAVQLSLIVDYQLLNQKSYQLIASYTGTTRHRVFGKWQFDTMKHDIAVVYYDELGKEHWLSYVNEDGHTGWEGYGRVWSWWWANSLPGYRNQVSAWSSAVEAWARQNRLNIERGYAVVKYKALITDQKWERDRQEKQTRLPWIDYMKLTWPEGKRSAEKFPAFQNPISQ